jgi:protein-L-isoaspartate(D-aspartate) O-methyltransferase
MGAKVYTIERQEELYRKTNQKLTDLGFSQIKCFLKDGFLGLPPFAPFDKIIVTAAPEDLPYQLIDQLVVGGIMVLPKGSYKKQKMVVLTKTSNTTYFTRKTRCVFRADAFGNSIIVEIIHKVKLHITC